MTRLPGLRLTALACLIVPAVVFAHGGEDHGEQPQAAPAPMATGDSVEGTSDRFEALLKLAGKAEPGKALEARLLLADADTNVPVSEASVELSLSGPSSETVNTSGMEAAGIYPANLPALQAGDYDVTVSVESGGESDLLLLGTLKVAAPETGAAEERPGSSLLRWLLGGVIVVSLLAFVLALTVRRRRRAQEVMS